MKRSILRWCVDFQVGFANVCMATSGHGWKFRFEGNLDKEFVAIPEDSAGN
jgi:hypothetical protein